MVWAAIWKEGRSKLVIMTRDELARKKGFSSASYIAALEEGLLPIYDGTCYFQQDNASIHRSYMTEAFLLNSAISLIDWPSHSPDLNPIEHVWAMLKRQLYKMFPWLANLHRNKLDIEVFKECLQKVWEAIPQSKICTLIESLPCRVEACRRAKG
jgi:hypothetical protein